MRLQMRIAQTIWGVSRATARCNPAKGSLKQLRRRSLRKLTNSAPRATARCNPAKGSLKQLRRRSLRKLTNSAPRAPGKCW